MVSRQAICSMLASAASLLAAPAFAQTASSCDAMLKDFDNHLTTNSIQPNDPRVTQARTQAEQACMSGDMTTAESSLDRAVADLGIPPRIKSGGGNGGATQSGGTSSQGTGSTNNTTSTGQSGTQNSNNTGSTTGSTTSGSTGTNSGQSGSTSTTQ